ncbi:MAG: heterodisulfide reductase-related iron-sulfur binding cluster [Candidatus Hodarchaeota archaeon]
MLHSIQFIKNLLHKENIPLKNLGLTVTYHDPCHIGRNAGVNPLYNEPREILSNITTLVEMKTIQENAKCCGAGGGVKKGFPDLALEIGKSRIKEAEDTGAEFLVSICPFCFRNLNDAISALNSNIKMIDLLELLDQALS